MNIRVILKQLEIEDFLKDKGFAFIGPYLYNNVPFKIKCKQHGLFKRSWTSIASSKYRYVCPECGWLESSKKQRHSLSHIKNKIKTKGYKCKNVEIYKNSTTKLKLICKNSHEFEINMANLHSGKGCPKCRSHISKNEEECKNIIESITGFSFERIRPEWLFNNKSKKRLELDGFCNELNIAFEYNGEFHYRQTYRKNDRAKLIKVKERDRIKRKLCIKNNIDLIVIPYYIKDKYDYIIKRLQKIIEKRRS